MTLLKTGAMCLTLVLFSCAPVYIPNSPIVFNNDKKGDYSVNFRQGFYSSNLQGGYAINDNLNAGVSVSALYTGDSEVFLTTYEGTKALDVSAVFGYYNKFTSNNTFELNAGVGPVFMTRPEGIENYAKVFLQPSITMSSKGRTRTDFTILFRGVGTSLTDVRDGRDTVINNGYFEPVLSLAIGNQIRFNTQLGLSIPFSQNYFAEYDYSPVIFNLGLGYTIPRNRKEATLP